MFIEHRFSQLVVWTSKPIEVGLFFSNIKSTGGAVFKNPVTRSINILTMIGVAY